MRRIALLLWPLAVGAVGAAQVPAPPRDLTAIVGGLASRTQQYYDRFVSIICTETVQQQELRFNLAPVGKPRMTVYELSVMRDAKTPGANAFRVERALLSINGRPARRNQAPGCTDPKTGSPDPLDFLLAENQKGFRFTMNRAAAGGPPGTHAIDFVQVPPDRVRIEWKENCFHAEGGGEEGRLWYDPETFDVLQVDTRLSKPFLIPMPPGMFGSQPSISVVRSDVTTRFMRVRFQSPDETALLPESIETLTVFRGVASLRTSQKLSNFRRFLAESVIR